jgi:tetratricopeptide (TPR) repeat protein
MRKQVRGWSAWISILLSSQLALAYPLAVQADVTPASELSYSDLAKLNECEQKLYGYTRKNLPGQQRIEALEVEMFGEKHQGAGHARIQAIASALDSGKTNLLMPPLAAELDRGQSAAQASVAPARPLIDDSDAVGGVYPAPATTQDKSKNLLREALKFYTQGQTSQAEDGFKRVLAVDQSNTDAYYNLGAIAEGKGDLNAALNYYNSGLRYSPSDPDLQNAARAVQTKLAQSTQSAPQSQGQAYASGNDLNKKAYLKNRINDASTAYKSGNYDAAIQILKEVSSQAPSEADVQYALSQCYKAKHQYMDARVALNVALNLDPNNQTYRDAVSDLDRRIASGGQLAGSTSTQGDTIASDSSASAAASPSPAGQLTPFSGVDTSPGWQSAGGSANSGRSGGYLPGYARHGYGSTSTTTRIERAAMGAMAGVAIGSLFGGGYRSRGRSAVMGGALGGLFGLMAR